MSDLLQTLAAQIKRQFGDLIDGCSIGASDVTVQVPGESLRALCLALRDEQEFAFSILIDLCGVDYLEYGEGAWSGPRFAVVYHLLSVTNNRRVRIKTFLDDEQPRVDSVIDIWASANWYEREAFDLFGILFDGHPDLRRLLTDYGFIGHPFRKDFPLSGNVEMRYDPERQRVVYEPVSIEPRVLVPRVIRHDHRYIVEPDEGADRG